jgi:hypothetical protein
MSADAERTSSGLEPARGDHAGIDGGSQAVLGPLLDLVLARHVEHVPVASYLPVLRSSDPHVRASHRARARLGERKSSSRVRNRYAANVAMPSGALRPARSQMSRLVAERQVNRSDSASRRRRRRTCQQGSAGHIELRRRSARRPRADAASPESFTGSVGADRARSAARVARTFSLAGRLYRARASAKRVMVRA